MNVTIAHGKIIVKKILAFLLGLCYGSFMAISEQIVKETLTLKLRAMTQKRVAKSAGVTRQFVSQCKNGEVPITGKLLAWLGFEEIEDRQFRRIHSDSKRRQP